MTRETKIGLLVGLAFIIVIGILLSDHLTTRGELPAAQLTQVGDNVRSASAVPVSANPPITPVAVPQNVAPTSTVMTHDELNTTPATAIVKVGPSPVNVTAGGMSINVAQASGTQTPAAVVRDEPVGQRLMGTAPIVTQTPTQAVAQNDPPMLPVNPGQTPAQVEAAANHLKQVKAERGDTVSRFAAKYLGGNTSANRQAILDVNPDLKANPAKVILGHTYLIPTAAKTTAVAEIPGTEPAALTSSSGKAEAKTEEAKGSKAGSHPTSTYTVKSNDTLWKIADGDPAVVKEIQELNKDILKGKTTLHPGVTLKVPAKTSVASR